MVQVNETSSAVGSDSSLHGISIAVVTNAAWNITNFRLPLIRRLKSEGAQVMAVAPDGPEREVLSDNLVEFVPLKNLHRSGTNPRREFSLIRELRSIYRKHEIDVALQFTIKPVIYGGFAAGGTDTKAISIMTGLGYAFLSNSLVSKIVPLLYERSLRRTSKVIFQNSDDRNLFISRSLVEAGKTALIRGSGVDTQDFTPGKYLPAKNKTFLFVGRLLRDKGIREFLAAAELILKTHPETKFNVIGGGDNENPASLTDQEIRRFADSGSVRIVGQVDDVRGFIADSDVVVLPSYREGMPRSILEAMAMGKPCITSNAPGCRDTIVDGESGFLVEPRSPQSIYQKMIDFIEMPNAKYLSMSEMARHRAVTEFSDQVILQQYVDVVRAVVEGPLESSGIDEDRHESR